MEPIHMQLSQKLKTFFSFLLDFRNLGLILDILRKKMTLIAYSFLRLRPVKAWLDICVKSPPSDYPSKRNMANESQPCLNLSEKTCGIFID